jgi:hypothetical protein
VAIPTPRDGSTVEVLQNLESLSEGIAMKLMQTLCSSAALAAVLVLTASAVQDKKPVDPKAGAPKAAPEAGAQHPMPEVKPGPEHARLAKTVGTWDATVTSFMTGAPQTTKGTETRRMVGDLWLVADFIGEFDGKPFAGHMISGFDQDKKKYVGTWVSSMQTAPSVSEGTYDDATKTLTCKVTCSMDGKQVTSTHVTEFKDNDTISTKMSGPGPDGKETTMMTIEYKRKKTSG